MKPNKIFIIRHGESQGNIDKTLYSKIPDYAIYLTEKGINQAKQVGQTINQIMGDGFSYGCYYSPYFRAHQTMDVAIKNIKNNKCVFKKEEVRIREQEYSGKLVNGRHDDDKERESYGKFFYRMNGGESGADVYDRVSDCIGSVYRDFEKKDFPANCLFFSHGLANRVFLMKFLHFTVEEFETWKNPRNGEIYILELQSNNKYKLITEIQKHSSGYGFKYENKV